jgi:hypothetical protein
VLHQGRSNQYNLSQTFVSQKLLNFNANWIEPTVVTDPQLDPSLSAHLNHLSAFFGIQGHRFFAQNVFALHCSFECMLMVQRHGSRQIDRVDLWIPQKVRNMRVSFGNLVAFLKVLETGGNTPGTGN